MAKKQRNNRIRMTGRESGLAYNTIGNNDEGFSFAAKATELMSGGLLQKSGQQPAFEFSAAGGRAVSGNKYDFAVENREEALTGLNPELVFPDSTQVSLLIRRVFDLVFSATVLVFLSPLFALIALLIKIQSPDAPVIFTQRRLGLNGEFFNLYKFRTMVPNAEKILADWLETRPEVKEEYFTYRKLKNDPRIIPWVGTFLRKSSLDELPQFLNVLLGDMAVVGPRPYIKEEFYQHSQEVVDRITSVKPGITGYWQTRERHENTFDSRVETDLEYLSVRSIVLDFQLVLQTVASMLLKKGA